MNTSFRLFPDTPAARGAMPGEPVQPQTLSLEAMALQLMMRGIHFLGVALYNYCVYLPPKCVGFNPNGSANSNSYCATLSVLIAHFAPATFSAAFVLQGNT